jgi:hypothetical protein
MEETMRKFLFVLLWLAAGSACAAEESQTVLKPGAGRDTVANNCMTCHSLDYIEMNSPFLDRKGWEGEVSKMITAYKAPVDQAKVPEIVDYLVRYYGVEKSAPAASGTAPGGR